MRAPTRILFAFGGRSGGFFEADSVNKVVEIVDNASVEAVELRSFIGLEVGVAFDRAEDAGGKGSVDPLEQFEEDQADRVSAREQLITNSSRRQASTTGTFAFSVQPFSHF